MYGLREGYKNSADKLVEIALEDGSSAVLDTYIFPILFSYRHSLEITLKHIYFRYRGCLPKGGHDLLILWDTVEREVIKGFINNKSAIEEVKKYKEIFIPYTLNGISLSKVRLLLKELQEANQRDSERINPSKKQADRNSEVWRYLISMDDQLYFTTDHAIDYIALKESISYIYETLDFIYNIVNDYLSS